LEKNNIEPRINEQILRFFNNLPKLREVRLIDEHGEQQGIVPAIKALDYAKTVNLDLIEISPKAEPPVCKIMDYGKFKYQQSKKNKLNQINTRQNVIKTLNFGLMIDEHDFNVKINNLNKFIKSGNKVKIVIRFKGREMSYPKLAEDLIKRIIESTAGISIVEKPAFLDGKSLMMILSPK
jgi:translation initiation factor IF-3